MSAPKGGETIFAEALRLPPEERAAYLAEATGENPELRQEVESLLQSYQAGEFLEEAATPDLRAAQRTVPLTERPGDIIGRYKLLQEIGQGGCGVVYMAEQIEPVRRRVALKIIKLGMDTKSVIARFEAERQALALMDHPNIAKVLDAGATETGRPYFVMELVRGTKITEFCDEKRLSTRERLDLFVQVCHAIQHAHQKGIIHRDIKPSNILVSEDDGMVVPKVIDFGIAKATGGLLLTDKTVFTAFEQFIGTPAYMSPEQALITNADIDTRSDIYALGVLLYELLTGNTPFDSHALLKIGLDEMCRTLREQEPPRPSTRLSTLSSQELSTTAERRGLDAPKLINDLRGDIDWIIMKALEKDRAHRYETANGLATDIQRHLKNEPVVARPPGRFYRLQKAIYRNQLAFTAAAAVGFALLIGTVVSTWQAARARRAEQTAEGQRDQAEAVLRFFGEKILAAGRPEGLAGGLGKDVSLRKAIDVAEPEVAQIFRNQPLVEATIRQILGESYSYLGAPALAADQTERAFALRQQHRGIEHAETLESMHTLGAVYLEAGRIEEGLALLESVLDLRKQRFGAANPSTLQTMGKLIFAYRATRQVGQAVAIGEEALRLSKANLGLEHRTTEELMNELSEAYMYFGKLDKAVSLIQGTIDICKLRLPPEHPRMLMLMHTLARTHSELGDWDRAVSIYEKVLELKKGTFGPEHPLTLLTQSCLARGYRVQGKTDRALELLQEVLKVKTATLGADHAGTLLTAKNINDTYRKAGELDKLEAQYRAELAQGTGDVITAGFELGMLLLQSANTRSGDATRLIERAREGEQLMREYLAEARVHHTNTPLGLGWKLDRAAEWLYRQGNYTEAEPLYRELIHYWRAAWGTENHYVLAAIGNQARLLADWAWAERNDPTGDVASSTVAPHPQPHTQFPPWARAREAEQLLREVLAARVRDSTNSWRIGDVMSRLGAAVLYVATMEPRIGIEERAAKLNEAASLLLNGYERLERNCAEAICKRDAIERIVRLYEVRENPEKLSEWQQKLELFDKSQQKHP